MRVTAWASAVKKTTGAGYGLRVSRADRDEHFRPEWQEVLLEIADGPKIVVPLAPCFWRGCTELRSAEIGRWLLQQDLAPWPKGSPPRFDLDPVGPARFHLRRPRARS